MRKAGILSILRSAVAAVALTAAAGGAWAENLADALIGAYNSSGLLDQNRALLRAADEDVAGAVAALRPVIGWTSRFQRNRVDGISSGVAFNRGETTDFHGITIEQLLYASGSVLLQQKAAQETVLATRQQLIAIEQSVLFRAVGAYLDVQLQTENVSLRENNTRLLSEELRAAQDRFEVGEVTRTDVALAESRLAAARSNLAGARGNLVSAQAEYTNAVGARPGSLAALPRLPARPASQQAAQDIAMRNHPSIIAAQHQVSAAGHLAEQAKAAMGPTVGLRADIGAERTHNSVDFTDNATLTLNLTQPIYAGGARASGHRKALAGLDSAKANLLNVQRDVAQGVSIAFVRADVARASLAATEERVAAARVAFEGIREEATLGARTTLDVLTAEQELLDALTSRESAKTEQAVAAYQMLVAQGLLTAEQLGLQVQIYDPTLYYNMVKGAPSPFSKQGKDLDRVLKALGKD